MRRTMRAFLLILLISTAICIMPVAQTTKGNAEADLAGETPSAPLPRLIRALSGHWSLQISYLKEQESEGTDGSGTEFWHVGPGGNSLVEEYHSIGKEGEISGLGIIWWDRKTDRLQVIWCDSTDLAGCSEMRYGARWEGDAVVIRHEREVGGRKLLLKEVFSDITPNSFTQTLYQNEAGADAKALVTIHGTRDRTPNVISMAAPTTQTLVDTIEASKSITAQAIRGHMRFLSDDLLEGRDTGSRGHEIAARYVATQLEAMGIQPGGEDGGYFQKIRLRKAVNKRGRNSLVLVRNGNENPLTEVEDYLFLADLDEADSSVEAPIIFTGYGVTAPELHYDDYAGIDARGKIVALFGNAPARFGSAERAYYADGMTKLKNAVDHGAVGVMALSLPEDEKAAPWTWVVPQIQAGSRDWLDGERPRHSFPQLRLAAVLNVSATAQLFSGAPRTLEQAAAIANSSHAQAFPLAWSARAHSESSHQTIESRNVVGKIEGSDPRLSDQYLAYSAHLDHLGRCRPVEPDGDTICHGTMDNASGVAAVLEIARAYTKLPRAPRRSVVFLFPTGEEGNLEGSDYFSHYPTLLGKEMVADINLDVTPGMRYPCTDLNAVGAEHSSLMRNAEWAAEISGYKVTPDSMPEENFFARSDQYSFALQGIPSVLIRNGADGGEVVSKWLQTRYHTPLDNMDQPIDYEAGVKASGMVFLMGYQVAQQDERPTWNKDDFFDAKFGAKRSR